MRRYNAVDKFYRLHQLIARAQQGSGSMQEEHQQNVIDFNESRRHNFELKNFTNQQNRAA